jgi:hypothetical protein
MNQASVDLPFLSHLLNLGLKVLKNYSKMAMSNRNLMTPAWMMTQR